MGKFEAGLEGYAIKGLRRFGLREQKVWADAWKWDLCLALLANPISHIFSF